MKRVDQQYMKALEKDDEVNIKIYIGVSRWIKPNSKYILYWELNDDYFYL